MPVYRPSTPSLDGVVTVTSTNKLPLPASDQKVITNVFTNVGTGNENAYTVTVGSTFYLMEIQLMHSAALTGQVFLDDGTTEVWTPRIAGSGSIRVGNGTPIAVYTTAQNVVVKVGLAGVKWCIYGIEVVN